MGRKYRIGNIIFIICFTLVLNNRAFGNDKSLLKNIKVLNGDNFDGNKNLNDYKLAKLGSNPNWSILDKYQKTITREEFKKLITRVYSFQDSFSETVTIHSDHAKIVKKINNPSYFYILKFKNKGAKFKPIERYYQPVWNMETVDEQSILSGVHIAIDPGHIGGDFAQMEERWFKRPKGKAVKEGELVMMVGNLLKKKLEQVGAKVTMVRKNLEPVTSKRPDDFIDFAKKILLDKDPLYEEKVDKELKILLETSNRNVTISPSIESIIDEDKSLITRDIVVNEYDNKVTKLAEKLFYRVSEIRERAKLVNEIIKPDLVMCIHFNAEDWGDPKQTVFSPNNHMHFLVNGCYSQEELSYDDMRFEMLERILQRTYYYEVSLAESISKSFAELSHLKAFRYLGDNAKLVNGSKYIMSRNLIANRLYKCPVVYCEPYVMNNLEVYKRIQAGEYEGYKSVAGKMRLNIFEEYARSLYLGIINYYKKYRPYK